MKDEAVFLRDELKDMVSMSNALSNLYDIEDFIKIDYLPKFNKSSKSLEKEFNLDKWHKLKEYIHKNKNVDIEDIEKIEDGNIDSYFFFQNKFFRVNPGFFRNYLKQKILNKLIRFSGFSNIENIAEIGCGYGSKLISIAKSSEELRKKNYKAFDISRNGLYIVDFFAKKYNIKLNTKLFNYRAQTFKEMKFENNSLLISCYGLTYKDEFKLKDLQEIINNGFIGGIHFEPCFNQLDQIQDRLYAALAKKYMIINDYTLNIANTFMEAKKIGIIDLKISKNISGVGLLPGNLISWEAK